MRNYLVNSKEKEHMERILNIVEKFVEKVIKCLDIEMGTIYTLSIVHHEIAVIYKDPENDEKITLSIYEVMLDKNKNFKFNKIFEAKCFEEDEKIFLTEMHFYDTSFYYVLDLIKDTMKEVIEK